MDQSIEYRSDRRTLRHATKLVCHVVRERGWKRIAESTLDVSTNGIRVLSNEDVAVGDEVVLSLRLPRSREYVDAQGRVVRVERGIREGDEGRAIAIAFTAIDPIDRAMLAGATAAIPPPIPRRALRMDYAATVRNAGL